MTGIGAWGHIDVARTNPMETMQVCFSPSDIASALADDQAQVWDGLSGARITFDSEDTPSGDPLSPVEAEPEVPHMARFVENLHLQRALLANLEAQGGVELIGGKKVASVVREVDGTGWPIVELEDGRRIRARLLVCSFDHRDGGRVR